MAHCGWLVGRVGAMAVALGVGWFAAAGWTAPVAVADPETGASSTPGSNRSDEGSSDATGGASSPGTRPSTSTGAADVDPEPSAGPETDTESTEAVPKASDKATDTTANRKRRTAVRDDTDAAAAATAPTAATESARRTVTVERTETVEKPTETPAAQSLPATPAPPEVVADRDEVDQVVAAESPVVEVDDSPAAAESDVVTSVVSGLVDALLSPFASSSTPTVPIGEPAAWAMMAAARRELDEVFVGPTIATEPLAAQTTSSVVTAPAAALPPEDQSLYTGQPSPISQLVTVGLRIVDVILQPFGGLLSFTSLNVPLFTDGVPPFFLTYGLDVDRTDVDGTPVWTLKSATPGDEVIVALHGGAYVAQASLFHWWTYADMARDTGATVVVPLYPLIPAGGTAAEVVPDTADFIAAMIAEHGAENVSVLGDSAGGGLALAATQELVRRGSSVPSRMVLLAPWLDATASDPRSAALDAGDPLLDLPNIRRAGADWGADLGADHPWASPINGSLAGLPPTTVISGSLDLLTPDSLRLRERTLTEGLSDFTFEFRNGQIHDWPIFGFLPDAVATKPLIYRGLLGP